MASKQIYFTVFYDTENGNFWVDDELLMSRIGTASWWDNDSEEWVRPDGDGEDEFDSRVSAKLGHLLIPERASTYFATDGSFGTAQNLEVIDTSEWTDEDWAEVENATDEQRAGTASAIANRYLNPPLTVTCQHEGTMGTVNLEAETVSCDECGYTTDIDPDDLAEHIRLRDEALGEDG
jgi:hypothetical protein